MYVLWVLGLMVTKVGFEFRDRNSIPSVYQITDDGLREVFYIYTVNGGLLLTMRYLHQ